MWDLSPFQGVLAIRNDFAAASRARSDSDCGGSKRLHLGGRIFFTLRGQRSETNGLTPHVIYMYHDGDEKSVLSQRDIS